MEARVYGREPLAVSAQPRCLSFFLLSPSATEHRGTLHAIREYALDILTEAGVDYRWVVEVDGEEAKIKWDELARERNEPEFMREQSAIPLEELKSNILEFLMNQVKGSSEGEDDGKSALLWASLRSIYAQNPLAKSDGYVTFDSFTSESLQAILKASATDVNVNVNLNSKANVNVNAKANANAKASWWSRKNPPSTAQLTAQSPLPLPTSCHHFPCTLSQSPLYRLQRFLFGQRELTRSIGEAVLQCIRQEDQK